MWWGGRLSAIDDVEWMPHARTASKTFTVPQIALDLTESNIELLSLMDGNTRVSPKKSSTPLGAEADSALYETSSSDDGSVDPLLAFDSVAGEPRDFRTEYWSDDKSFWAKWKAEEAQARRAISDNALAKLSEEKESHAAGAAAAAAAASLEEAKRVHSNKNIEKSSTDQQDKISVDSGEPTISQPVRFVPESGLEFEKLMEKGKHFRSEFIQYWREIALCVSTTAANARSIQSNSSKLITCFSRASIQATQSRPEVTRWLAGVCGSKIISQASSGNKCLVWSFAYLIRIVADKFPDVLRVGAFGELTKACPKAISGITGGNLETTSTVSPQDAEIYTRMWVAILCVFCDQQTFWEWSSHSLNQLLRTNSFIGSSEAMWSMMRTYVFLDIGFYDFKRYFGSQAVFVIDILEKHILPRLDKELQNYQQATSTSVQFRFYLDACFNILQSRKYTVPPEGQVLAATKESELNPEL